MSGTTRSTSPSDPRARIPAAERTTLLRAVADSIAGRGRVVGPAGGWVRTDFDDIRQHLGATG